MAYREVTMIEVKEVLRQWLSGRSRRAIARFVGIDRNTVRHYIRLGQACGMNEKDGVASLTDERLLEVATFLRADPVRPPGEAWTKCHEHRDEIARLIKNRLRLTKVRKLLMRQGIEISYPTLHRFASSELGFGRGAPTIPVADCDPGQELQVDTGWMGLLEPDERGKRRRFRAFIFTAVRSRHRFVYPTFGETTHEAIEACEAAWIYYHGVFREAIKDLHRDCEGNRVRVWEELGAKGTTVPYQSAALILCHSRMLYAQCYPTFNRFYAKIFLTEALLLMGGAARRCVIDDTSIVIAHGTGKKAVIAPEMEAFAERFGFTFVAHAVGDVNRKGRIERPFAFVEKNFYPGRTFADLADLNRQMIQWCEKGNAKGRRHLGGSSPASLFRSERPDLLPLPLYVPEVYALHVRVVDPEGMVHLHNNRYSAPEDLIGRRVEVKEAKDKVTIMAGHAAALAHGLFDASRIERMVLRNLAGEFFQLPLLPAPGKDESPGDHAEEETREDDGDP